MCTNMVESCADLLATRIWCLKKTDEVNKIESFNNMSNKIFLGPIIDSRMESYVQNCFYIQFIQHFIDLIPAYCIEMVVIVFEFIKTILCLYNLIKYNCFGLFTT